MKSWLALAFCSLTFAAIGAEQRPNILFAIADDWGLHAGAYGDQRLYRLPEFRFLRRGFISGRRAGQDGPRKS